LEAIRRHEAVCEAVRLDDDEEAALGEATVNDLVISREILLTNFNSKPIFSNILHFRWLWQRS